VILSTALTLNYLVKHFFYFHFYAEYHILILLLHCKNICRSPVMFRTHCQLMVTFVFKDKESTCTLTFSDTVLSLILNTGFKSDMKTTKAVSLLLSDYVKWKQQ